MENNPDALQLMSRLRKYEMAFCSAIGRMKPCDLKGGGCNWRTLSQVQKDKSRMFSLICGR
jgi:hypothetical protein